jgi:hypothetical protein
MKAIVRIDPDFTGEYDIIIQGYVFGDEVIPVFGGPSAMTTINFDMIDGETAAQRKTRALSALNQWRIDAGLPLPTKIIYSSTIG